MSNRHPHITTLTQAEVIAAQAVEPERLSPQEMRDVTAEVTAAFPFLFPPVPVAPSYTSRTHTRRRYERPPHRPEGTTTLTEAEYRERAPLRRAEYIEQYGHPPTREKLAALLFIKKRTLYDYMNRWPDVVP